MWRVEFIVTDSRDPFEPLKRGETEGPHLMATVAHLISQLDLSELAMRLKPMTMTDREMIVLLVIKQSR